MASKRCLCGECGLEAGSVIIASKICRAVRESESSVHRECASCAESCKLLLACLIAYN